MNLDNNNLGYTENVKNLALKKLGKKGRSVKKDINPDLRKAISHILGEMEFVNIATSVKENFEMVRNSHDSIHEFVLLASLSHPAGASWHSKSAFLTYHQDAFHQAHRSFLEALSGHYNAGYVLLRSTLELLVRGAFWECFAHEKFRNNAKKLYENQKGRSLRKWINDIIKLKPSIKEEFENTSAGIFDKISPLFKNPELRRKCIPPIGTMIAQLEEWKILDTMPNPSKTVYDLYSDLSADIHVIPDRTDIGRRLLSQKDLFETEVIPSELTSYMKFLSQVIDISTIIEFNVLKDWLPANDSIKNKLKDRLSILEGLGLKYSVKKLQKTICSELMR